MVVVVMVGGGGGTPPVSSLHRPNITDTVTGKYHLPPGGRRGTKLKFSFNNSESHVERRILPLSDRRPETFISFSFLNPTLDFRLYTLTKFKISEIDRLIFTRNRNH